MTTASVNFTAASLESGGQLKAAPSNSGQFQYAATLSAAADHPIQVTFQTSAHGSSYGDATATGMAADYTPVTTTLTFAAGSLTPSSAVTVNIKGDTLPGPDELFNASLSKTSDTAPFGAKLGNVTTTSTILNDDGSDQSDLTVSLVSSTVATSEGGIASFGLQLSRLSESPVVITYHTSDGASHTATADRITRAPRTLPRSSTAPRRTPSRCRCSPTRTSRARRPSTSRWTAPP